MQEVWQTVPELCVKVLGEFLNILQGQSPAGLKNEPTETTSTISTCVHVHVCVHERDICDCCCLLFLLLLLFSGALFDLLVKMVSEPVEGNTKVTSELVSLASSCLLSLVVALGETDKLLAAISALLLVQDHISSSSIKVIINIIVIVFIVIIVIIVIIIISVIIVIIVIIGIIIIVVVVVNQIPAILRSLQASVQAILLGSLTETDWIQNGVLDKSLTDSWPLGQPLDNSDNGPDVAIATDSSYLYVHGPFGLMKVGLGYGSTTKVNK